MFFKAHPLNSSLSVDYIIVGQGLAGSCLAMQLIKRNKKVVVIDKPHDNSATRVAAGLFNPITGRNLSKTWKADVLFQELHRFYREVEEITGAHFFHPMPLYRPFVSIEEQNEWMGKSANEDFAPYIQEVCTTPSAQQFVRNPFGGIRLQQCGYVNTLVFLQAVRTHIQQKGVVLDEVFDETALTFYTDHVEYKQFRASKIIFCQGVEALQNKLFSWLPIRPLKGETLSIKPSVNVPEIYNRGVYVVPGLWRVGATYQYADTTPAITEAGRLELIEKLEALLAFPYEVVGQSWGMRPTTPDRKPIVGSHPDHPHAVVFNGLGTKGVSLAPYFSQVLATWLENNGSINKEVDIDRYKHYNYGGNLSR